MGPGFEFQRSHFSWNNSLPFGDRTFAQRTDGVGANPAPRKTRHVYFGLEVIQEYECGGAQSVGSCGSALLLVRDFVWGDPERYPEVVAMQTYTINFPEPEDPPVSVPSAAYHYLHDVLGSVIGLVDETGLMRERYTYDPYGKVFIEKWDAAANGGSGAWAASETDCGSSTCGKLPVSSVGNPFMWTGHRYDAAVGLYATHFRTYSPTLGRWLQRDPIEYDGGSINLHEYVLSSPLSWIDPLGLETRVKDGPCGPPPDEEDEEKEKCLRAAEQSRKNCIKGAISGDPLASTVEDCIDNYNKFRKACEDGTAGQHDEKVMRGWDYVDCVGRCIDAGGGSLTGAGIMILGKNAGGFPVLKSEADSFLRDMTGRGSGGLGGPGKSAWTTSGSIQSTVLQEGGRSWRRVIGRIAAPLWVIDTAYTVGLEGYCAVAYGANNRAF